MKKALVAAVLIGLTGGAYASEMNRPGFSSLSKDMIKGVNIVINNTSVNNGSSSINSNVSVTNANSNIAVTNNSSHNGISDINTAVNASNGNINAGVTNNSANNGSSRINTSVNAHNGNITAGVNNNNNGNLDSNTNTSVNAQNGNIGATVNNSNIGNGAAATHTDLDLAGNAAPLSASIGNNNVNNGTADTDNVVNINTRNEDGASLSINNTDNGNGIARTDNDVTVNGVNANAKPQTYTSMAAYRFKEYAMEAMTRAMKNLNTVKGMRITSAKVIELPDFSCRFEVKFTAPATLQSITSSKTFDCLRKAGKALRRDVIAYQNQNRRVISEEIIELGYYSYSYAIAYFPAK